MQRRPETASGAGIVQREMAAGRLDDVAGNGKSEADDSGFAIARVIQTYKRLGHKLITVIPKRREQ